MRHPVCFPLDRLFNQLSGTRTLVWFGVTITGVTFFSCSFPHEQSTAQVIGIAVLIGGGWLTYRVGD